MSKIIGAIVIILVLYGGWELWVYWDTFDKDQDLKQKEAASQAVVGDQLSGMPSGWDGIYRAAKEKGPEAVKAWMKKYGKEVQDPRLAWIELDYMVSIAHDDPVEAKKIFADVKSRITESSPVYKRVKELEKTYE